MDRRRADLEVSLDVRLSRSPTTQTRVRIDEGQILALLGREARLWRTPRRREDLERGARRIPYPATVRCLADALRLSAADHVAFVAAAHPSTDASALRGDLLPLPATSFVGREGELAEVRRLLDSGRLLTLTSPGGSGKTRLAIEAVRSDPSGAPHGRVVLVLLASLARSELVAPTIGQAPGIREIAGQSLLDTLVAYLRPRRMLLLLDNLSMCWMPRHS